MIISKVSRKDRQRNAATLDQLHFSLFDLNIYGVQRLLSETGTFLGQSKMRFVSQLNSKFNQLKDLDICGINIHSGLSLDVLPGCDVVEVRYLTNPDLLDENGLYFSEPDSQKREGEFIIRFVVQMKAGEIIGVRRVSKYLPIMNWGEEQMFFFN